MLANIADVDARQQTLEVRQQNNVHSYFPVLKTSADFHTPYICFGQKDISTSLYGVNSSNKNMKNSNKTK